MADAQARKFDIVLSEALDRISRDQEDVAAVYKRMRFANVRMVTLSEGEISELHVGLKNRLMAPEKAAEAMRAFPRRPID